MTLRLFLLLAAALFCGPAPARASLLEQAQKRGYISCGVTRDSPGFSQQAENGEWRGFDVDFCRALASAIFDDANKVRYTALAAKERASALQAGWVDLLAGGAAWTQSRDAGQRLLYAAISFHDGQGFLTRHKQSLASAQDLAGKVICVQQGASHELELADFFHARKIGYEARLFPSFEDAAKAYDAEGCDALTGDLSQLYAARAKLVTPAGNFALPDLVSKAPHGPIVRQGDDQWFNVVRWTFFALLDAEELDISSANADDALKSEDPETRRLLGVEGDHGDGLGLTADWAYRIVKHVGNYGEIFERNLGHASPLGMERRHNALWTKGGLMFAPPVR